MMEFLTDTNVLFWAHFEPRKLSRKVKGILQDPFNKIYYSPINMWEISLKYGVGKLKLGSRRPEDFLSRLEDDGQYHCLELPTEVIAASYLLPWRHRDPFDRMLVWQAIQSGCILLSADAAFEAYVEDGLRLVVS